MTELVDMTGTVVNGIEVLCRDGVKGGKPAWSCKCTCGAIFRAVGTSLRVGRTRECRGCAEKRAALNPKRHGQVGSREYVSYSAMKQRCYYQKNKRYARYGGRGITVCARWLESFNNFLADMGPQPRPDYSIERIDVDKGYEPDNCVWATRSEQANNRSNNTSLEINGRTQNLTQWSRETGVNRTVILRRMKRGLSGEALIHKGA